VGERPLTIRYAFEGSNMPEDVTMLDYRAPASTSSDCGTRRISDSYMKFRVMSEVWAPQSGRVVEVGLVGFRPIPLLSARAE
jgi:hypothetical protein